MNYIKYDDYDLLWLFENEPTDCVGEPLADIKSYSKIDDKGLELNLRIDTYANQCDVRLYFNEVKIFNASLKYVTSLKKHDETLIINVKEEPVLKLKFKNQLAVELISVEDRKWYKDYS